MTAATLPAPMARRGSLSRGVVPLRAYLVEMVSGTVPGDDGGTFTIERYRVPPNYADAGTEFLRMTRDGRWVVAWAYSGRRTDKCAEEYQTMIADIGDWITGRIEA